jgi:hypothetical protein
MTGCSHNYRKHLADDEEYKKICSTCTISGTDGGALDTTHKYSVGTTPSTAFTRDYVREDMGLFKLYRSMPIIMTL